MFLLFKKFKKTVLFSFISFVLLLGVGCQKEETEYIDTTVQGTITANSVVSTILGRTAQNEGSWDDVIDGTSCAAVQYPLTVIANGQEVILQSIEDVQLIVAIFAQFPNDTDTLEIVFPITLIMWDYTEVVVNSQEELNQIIANCISNGQGDDEISCIGFQYPITIYTYNSAQEQTGTVVINSDFELFQFIQNLDENDVYSLDFPVTVILYDGSTQTVNNTQELQYLIESCENSTNTNPDPTQFEADLTTGVWYVTYYFDDYDQTDNYQGYQFSFNTDGSSTASNGTNTVNGSWEYDNDENIPEFELDFGDDDPFDELDEDWEIIEADSEIIKLRDVSGDGSVNYLTFERNPNTTGSNEELNNLIQHLTTDSWFVNLMDDGGEDKTCNFVTYEFSFDSNGIAQAVSTSNTVTGYWTAQMNDGQLEVILNFDTGGSNEVFDNLNDDWEVLVSSNTAINLRDVSEGSGETDYLNFKRSPYTGCGGGGDTAADVENILQDGQWFVAGYLDEGYDETSDYAGYTITFNSGGSVTATNGTNTNYGTWSVAGTTGSLELLLDFGTDEPFEDLNEEWDIIESLTNKITLQHISSEGGVYDLILEKL